ncbi:ribose transport system permease protein [Nocardioides scoriae]|uniref:Autoinducer 2 import system permease protein LsrC n=1 Tax=Nocardioides scoriae TaxID=642780 RepID=A0A1H1Y8F5_9ACTN|nr:ABC transporter permease [Nocardioides scoriae]SDT17740.1 ribose transport system permease protein [Nocardioides scoriae]
MSTTDPTAPRAGTEPGVAPPAPRPTARQRLGSVAWPEVAAPAALVLLLVGFGIADPGFLATGNLGAMLQAAAILMVLVLGQTFVVATAGIDLSVASTMTLSAIALGETYSRTSSILLAVVVALVTGVAVGVLNGLLITKGRITDFIVTLGMLSAASGLALIVADGKPTQVIDRFLLDLTVRGFGIVTWAVLLALVLTVLAHLLLFRTSFGTHLLAVGGSVRAARASGVRTDRVKIAAYALSGSCAGTAAVLLVGRVGASEPASNTSFLLNSVAAVVLGGVSLFGGRATIVSPIAGALLLTALVNGLTRFGLSEFYQPLAVGVVVIAAAFLARFDR